MMSLYCLPLPRYTRKTRGLPGTLAPLVHTVRGTAGNVNDVVEANSLLHGDETDAFGNAGYQGVDKRPDARAGVAITALEIASTTTCTRWP